MMLAEAFAPVVDAGSCPHLAILLDRAEDAPAVLARFYALGARRGAWLYHRALPGGGDYDRRALARAGLDVDELERPGRMRIDDQPLAADPAGWVDDALAILSDAEASGYERVWWSRFPVPSLAEYYRQSLSYDAAFHEAMRTREAVSLCLYVVGDLDAATRDARQRELAAVHDGLLVPAGDGLELLAG